MSPISWEDPPAELHLEAGETHVWRMELEPAPGGLPALLDMLAPQERERAGRFVFERDRLRFVCARGLLRSVLARYLGKPPASLVFEYGPHGKPFLPEHSGPGGLRFNLSHSGSLAAIALVRGAEIGVDIERVNPEIETAGIASLYFAPPEVSALEAVDPGRRVEAFFELWTRKEALLKAWGEGVTYDLHRFAVPACDAAVGRPGQPGSWYLRGFQPAPGFAGAIAVQGGPLRSGGLFHLRFQADHR